MSQLAIHIDSFLAAAKWDLNATIETYNSTNVDHVLPTYIHYQLMVGALLMVAMPKNVYFNRLEY